MSSTKISYPASASQLNWLAILRSITIVLVVMTHVRLWNTTTEANYTFITTINTFFAPLRMPVFIMVSGALLYYTRINKGWKTLALYKDKAIRIGLPLLFCTILGNGMQLIFNGFVKNPIDITFTSFLQSFVLYTGFPWPHRWYLATLLIMMALYPLFIRLNTWWKALLCWFVLFGIYPINLTIEHNWFQLFTLNKYLIFFYTGIVIFQFEWWKKIQQHATIIATVMWIIYIIGHLTKVNTLPFLTETFPILQLYSIFMMLSSAMVIAQIFPNCFALIHHYIFQIYLFGIAFQAFIELIVWRGIGCPNSLVILFYILNILVGIYAPIGLSLIVKKTHNRFLQLCIGLKPKKAMEISE